MFLLSKFILFGHVHQYDVCSYVRGDKMSGSVKTLKLVMCIVRLPKKAKI